MTATVAWRLGLSALLLIACATDVRARRIPNALVIAVAAFGAARAMTLGAPGHALLLAAAGGLLGLALWLPAYVLGVMGAGDVKLFGAAAVWLGPASGVRAALFAAIAGGLLGGVWLAAARRGARPRSTVPYGVAIAAGTLAVTWGLA